MPPRSRLPVPLFAPLFSAVIATALLAGAPASAASVAASTADSAAAPAAPRAGRQLDALADAYYQALSRFEPLTATESGDNRFDDQLGTSIYPAQRLRQAARYRQFAQRLRAIPRAQLDTRQRSNYDVLAYELNNQIERLRFPEHLLPINQMDSMPMMLANYAGGEASQPLSTVAQFDAYLSRLRQLPGWTDQAIANMREGMRRGITVPRPIMLSALPQFKALLSDTPEANIFYTPVSKLPAGFSPAERARLSAAYRKVVAQDLMPALARLAAFLEQDYLPACRSSTGLDALPDGAAWYRARVADATTTTLTPEQIHATGLKEVARIQAQFAVLGPKLGYQGEPAGLPVWVAQQDKFRPFKTEQEVQAVFHRLNDLLDTKLPQMFTLLPKAKLDLRLEPELSRATASDHYTAPAGDGSRPGVFWSVVNDPAKYGSTGMTTLFLHEGKPGHHFHIALMQELTLPDFRKFGGNNAYTEGWALYAETLGKEMGLFDDPAQYFGHLNDELLRAVRLVVDTGMHAKGWSRERSIAYMHDTLGYEDDARTQTERYMVWPGQALGYKIGQLKILALRDYAKTELGNKFDIRGFHDTVLGAGPLPMDVLEKQVKAWVEAKKKG